MRETKSWAGFLVMTILALFKISLWFNWINVEQEGACDLFIKTYFLQR